MRLEDYDIQTRFAAKVLSSKRITPLDFRDEIREIELQITDQHSEMHAGQAIGVLAPGQEAFGQQHHLRLYTLADVPQRTDEGVTHVTICVKRCNYLDEFSGEEYRGVASNYICDLQPGDELVATGPYEGPFKIPGEPDSNLILIGAGTGIAPFRAFLKNLYQKVPSYSGYVCLLYGGTTGLDLVYMNEQQNDFVQYYDKGTFEAIAALSQRPHWSDTPDWHGAVESRAEELWARLEDVKTYVYVAGLEPIRAELDAMFAKLAGSAGKWQRRKAELIAGKRWVELLY